jgi:hypothetical protein
MKITGQFLKYLIVQLLPVYATILWLVMHWLELDYWNAYWIASLIYAVITFPFVKNEVFK